MEVVVEVGNAWVPEDEVAAVGARALLSMGPPVDVEATLEGSSTFT